MTPKAAVIIVTYNGSRYIKNCLASVFANDYERLTVIVVDNGSSDDTVALVEKHFPQVELIKLRRNLGFSGGNNVGINRALRFNSPPFQGGVRGGYDYVILLNQDTEVADNWLTNLVKAAADEQAGIVQSMLLLGKERALTNNVGNAMHYLGFGFIKHYREPAADWLGREPFEIGYASGAAMLIKREVLEKVALQTLTPPSPLKGEGTEERLASSLKREGISYFNPLFFAYHEDLDLCWRARLAGYKIMIAPRAIVYHYYQFNRNKKMFYWTERNRWACLLQNYSLPTLVLLLPMLVAVELMMLVYSLFTGWFLQKIKSYLWILAHLPSIIIRRQQIQSRRIVNDNVILRAMDAKLEFSEVDNSILQLVLNPVVEWYYKKIRRLTL